MRTLIPEAVTGVAGPLSGFRGGGRRATIWRWVVLGGLGLVWLWPLAYDHRLVWLAVVWNAVLVVMVVRDLALTTRGLLLFCAGFAGLVPAFFHAHRVWPAVVWDGVLLGLCVMDAVLLPAMGKVRVGRRFLDSPRLGVGTRVELEVVQEGARKLEVDVTDALEATLMPMPRTERVEAYPRDPVRAVVECFPGRRGEVLLGDIFLKYRAGMKLVERWARVPAGQGIRVFPAMEENGERNSLYLMRARQIELQKRRIRLRGMGREFESLREYQRGDELRNLSWTATAKRGKLITRQFTTERSQQVWVVLDAGRLSRTAFVLKRREEGKGKRENGGVLAETEQERAEALLLTVTQLDQATTAAVMLAEAVFASGDKCGLLTYGRGVQQQLLPGAGAGHLRVMIDQLSQVKGEAAEANHLGAAQRLKQLQRRRGLIVWITEIADSAGRPEIVAAAVDLVRRHLVLLVVLEHPELAAMAGRDVKTAEEMYQTAAAKEMLDRRREALAKLRQAGVLVVETGPGEVGVRTINSYLDVKARGLI